MQEYCVVPSENLKGQLAHALYLLFCHFLSKASCNVDVMVLQSRAATPAWISMQEKIEFLYI